MGLEVGLQRDSGLATLMGSESGRSGREPVGLQVGATVGLEHDDADGLGVGASLGEPVGLEGGDEVAATLMGSESEPKWESPWGSKSAKTWDSS